MRIIRRFVYVCAKKMLRNFCKKNIILIRVHIIRIYNTSILYILRIYRTKISTKYEQITKSVLYTHTHAT